jgi:hypothetical protein
MKCIEDMVVSIGVSASLSPAWILQCRHRRCKRSDWSSLGMIAQDNSDTGELLHRKSLRGNIKTLV